METRRRGRLSLEHQGGPAERHGDPVLAERLADALQAVHDAPRDPLTHGFHTYPARMHYAIARRVLEQWSEPRTRVLDPFCGSGTVLVEARRLGLRSCGVDLNPVGLRVAEVKCALRSQPERERFAELASAVVEASLERVQGRVKVLAPLSAAERQWYLPHVLLEMAGLHAEIEALEPGFDQRALQMVFSSILVKYSRQRSETAPVQVQQKVGKTVVSRFFGRKSEELLQRWTALAEDSPPQGVPPKLSEGDARGLRKLLGGWQFDLVLSSPPYGGTYDYVDHHARRYPWLGLSDQPLRDGEIGARRRLSEGRGAARVWEREVEQMLRSTAEVLSARGEVVLLIGDAEVGGRRIEADRQLQSLAGRAGLQVVASAAQRRPDWGGGTPRREHLVALRHAEAKTPGKPESPQQPDPRPPKG
ncbi:MAG: site-specific DNA-methyltransferase [Deltaproteobacteria bacterium]|nr:site-specific DNA-methyltransferase [Deltaproteobacteria bacterium]